MKEIWKPIKGYEGIYEVSNKGRVKTLDKFFDWANDIKIFHKGRVIKNQTDADGYEILGLSKNKIRKTAKVHRLVAQAFIPNPKKKPHVNHVDNNRKNNNVFNLEWVTPSENSAHMKNQKRAKNQYFGKINSKMRDDIRNYYYKICNKAEVARVFKISAGGVALILKEKK